jgi:hypothetical protein
VQEADAHGLAGVQEGAVIRDLVAFNAGQYVARAEDLRAKGAPAGG